LLLKVWRLIDDKTTKRSFSFYALASNSGVDEAPARGGRLSDFADHSCLAVPGVNGMRVGVTTVTALCTSIGSDVERYVGAIFPSTETDLRRDVTEPRLEDQMEWTKEARTRKGIVRMAGAFAAMALVVGACGGSDETPSGAREGAAAPAAATTSDQRVTLEAVDNTFSTEELSLPAGAVVELTFTNNGANPHTFTSSALGVDTGTVAPGDSATVTFSVPDEPTEFLCSLHGAGGMTGVIVPE
jgi:plastocyanin